MDLGHKGLCGMTEGLEGETTPDEAFQRPSQPHMTTSESSSPRWQVLYLAIVMPPG